MSYKKLLFKYECEILDNGSLPSFSKEEIGHILLTIEQIPIFEEKEIELKQFPEKFRNIINETRLDITFIYTSKMPLYHNTSGKLIGYKVNDDKQKTDIVSFFTKIKDSKSEFRIYQIGGKYSEAMEDARVFGKELKDKPKEEVLRLLEGIKKSKDFKKYHPAKKLYYLNKLREIYRQLENDKQYWKMQREIEKSFGDNLDTFRSVKGEYKIDENPFNVSLEKFNFLKKDQVHIPRTKSVVHKKEYLEEHTLPEMTIDDIGDILIDARMMSHYFDYEEVKHQVNFRNIKEGTRKDISFHYAHIVPIYGDSVDESGVLKAIGQKITGQVIKVDNVSFFTNVKDGISEHRIYQIGARYEATELTVNDLYGLGDLNYDAELYDEAIKLFKRGLEIKKDDLNFLVILGLCYVCKEEFSEAIRLYQKALEIDSEDAVTWDNLGIAYEYLKDLENARKAYQKAFDLEPENKEIKEHFEEIENRFNQA